MLTRMTCVLTRADASTSLKTLPRRDNLIDLDEFKDLLKEEIQRFKAVSSFCVIA